MPASAAMAAAVNAALSPDAIDAFDPDLLAPGQTLETAIKGAGHDMSPRDAAFVASIPPSIQEGIRAALFTAVSRDPRIPVTMAWAPSTMFQLSVWEAPASAEAPGAMTILLEGPPPP